MKKSKTVRMPVELIEQIQGLADKEGRSFTNMLIRILEAATTGQKKAA